MNLALIPAKGYTCQYEPAVNYVYLMFVLQLLAVILMIHAFRTGGGFTHEWKNVYSNAGKFNLNFFGSGGYTCKYKPSLNNTFLMFILYWLAVTQLYAHSIIGRGSLIANFDVNSSILLYFLILFRSFKLHLLPPKHKYKQRELHTSFWTISGILE